MSRSTHTRYLGGATVVELNKYRFGAKQQNASVVMQSEDLGNLAVKFRRFGSNRAYLLVKILAMLKCINVTLNRFNLKRRFQLLCYMQIVLSNKVLSELSVL